MNVVGEYSLNHYCCFLLGSRYWFLEVLFRRPRYIVFPNLSLSVTEDLKGFSRNRRALCFIYDKDLQSIIGVIRCLDIALAVQLDEFYKENVYGVTVPTEWFWDKWGGVGIGVIITRPSYIHKLPQPLSIDALSDIVFKAGEEKFIKGIRELIEEACLSGFSIATTASVYRLFQVLQLTQELFHHYRIPLQQIEVVNMLTDIGSKLGYKVDTLNVDKKSIDIVWIDRSTDKIAKIFKVCSAKNLVKILEKISDRKKVDNTEYWVTLYDTEYGIEYAKNILPLVRSKLGDNVVFDTIKIIGWREVLDVHKVVLGISGKILVKS